MRTLIIIFLLFAYSLNSVAQELNCQVKVQTPQLQIADPKLFKTMETAIFEFMSNTKWGNDEFAQEEKIDCSIFINITKENSVSSFEAEVTIQSNRPVYNSSYNSVTFLYRDNVSFEYVEFQPIEFNENTYTTELSSLLAFYAYTVLGYDYDSFSPMGGNAYFQKAQQIINFAQNSPAPGWKAFDSDRSRYWLMEQLLNNKYADVRSAFYTYHRQGLDQMYEDPKVGRSQVINALKKMEAVQKDFPNTMPVRRFMEAKSDELVQIFKDGSIAPNEKAQATNALFKLDPAQANKYRGISAGGTGSKATRPTGPGGTVPRGGKGIKD